jgi:gliding motility-associated-like protein
VAVCANDLPYLWNGLALNGSGTESVSLVAANGCDSLATLNLTVSDPPSIVDVQQSCGPFTWVDGVTYTASTNTPQFNYVGAAAGGCDSLVTLDLTITEPPTADFEWIIPDSGEGVGPLELSDLSTGSPESWSWTLFTSSGVFTATGANPLVYLPDDVNGPVEVVLEVVDANGCTDLTSQTQIWSSPTPFALFLPTAITPNNDGINDVFRAEGVGIDPERFRMELFNRWGESVFVSTDPEAVWLGEVRQGDYWVGDGIYSYIVQAAGKNQIEVMTYRGSVTVMR